MLAGRMLRLAASRFPGKTALIEGSERTTFAALDADADRFAAALHGLGLGPGHRIAAMMPNVLAYPVVHFGAARSGVTLAHLSFRYAARDIVYVLNKIAAEAVVFHASVADAVRAFAGEVPTLRHLIAVGDDHGIGTALSYDALLSAAEPAVPDVSLSDDDPYSITFTGGTTGFPKAVVVSHRSRTVSAISILAQHGLDHDDHAAVVTPIFHAAGLFVWFQPVLWLGCTSSLLRNWDPVAFMDMVERDGVTAAFLVPTQLNGLIKHPEFDTARLSSLRKVGYAGSPMPGALISRLRELFPDVEFTENYGQSETGPMTIKRHWEHDANPDSIGRAAFNVETDIFDDEGRPVPPGVPGEIVTRGDHLLVEYFDDAEQTRALYRKGDGWLWTGDVGVRDEDGFITLVDRSKDMIISGAENIYPKEIEAALYRHEAVNECAVFGIPDEHWGEVPAAHVVLKAGCAVSTEELIEFSLQYIARYKRPRLVEIVEALPKTPVGKIQKHLIRAAYWKDSDRKL